MLNKAEKDFFKFLYAHIGRSVRNAPGDFLHLQPAPKGAALNFADAGQVSSYAVQAMRWAVENGIISGYNATQLAPDGLATRAQAASMLMRYMER